MDRVPIGLRAVICIRVNGRMGNGMGRVYFYILMVTSIMGIIKKINEVGKAHSPMQMVINIPGNGKMGICMERAYTCIKAAINMKVPGRMINDTGKVFIPS